MPQAKKAAPRKKVVVCNKTRKSEVLGWTNDVTPSSSISQFRIPIFLHDSVSGSGPSPTLGPLKTDRLGTDLRHRRRLGHLLTKCEGPQVPFGRNMVGMVVG